MADKNIVKAKKALRRRKRVRRIIIGTPDRPRLSVTKSLNNIFAQIVDDVNHVTVAAVATNSKNIQKELKKSMTKTEKAFKVGLAIGNLAKEKGIEKIVFDRNVSRYHGRIKAVADGARKSGLKF